MESPVKIVAEIGINHNGDLDTARKLVDVAIDAGCDAVKFQTFWNIPEFAHLNFSKCEWYRLILYCELQGIEWFSTPFDLEAVRFLDELGMETWKLPSNIRVLGDQDMLDNIQYSKSRKQTIISTGISNMWDIYKLMFRFNDRPVTLLHCVSKYPTPIDEMNLFRIGELQKRFGVPVGLSDHSTSIFAVPIGALKMGAVMLEKHITLDRDAVGPDHLASLNPSQLVRMVGGIRKFELECNEKPIKK